MSEAGGGRLLWGRGGGVTSDPPPPGPAAGLVLMVASLSAVSSQTVKGLPSFLFPLHLPSPSSQNVGGFERKWTPESLFQL